MAIANDTRSRRPMTAGVATDVRTCPDCGRPLPALTRDEYTRARARLVDALGICVCRQTTSRLD